MHRGCDDVVRRLIAQLHDEFTEVGLENPDSLLFERGREMNFLGNHGFRFRDGAHTTICSKVNDIAPRLFGVFSPKYVATELFHAALKFFEITIEMIYGFALDALAFLARRLPIEESRAAAADCGVVMINATAQNLAMNQISGLRRRVSQKILRSGHDFTPAPDIAALRRRSARECWPDELCALANCAAGEFLPLASGSSDRWRSHTPRPIFPRCPP